MPSGIVGSIPTVSTKFKSKDARNGLLVGHPHDQVVPLIDRVRSALREDSGSSPVFDAIIMCT